MLDKAQKRTDLKINVLDIRSFAQDKHQLTDESPFGGGAGMVMKIEPIDLALQSLGCVKGQTGKKIILTSAKGKLFNQQLSSEYSKLTEISIICGHYQGVDERVARYLVDEELRIGEFVMTGGEPVALMMLDSVVRLLPSVLGNEESLNNESHQVVGLSGFPLYTRPADYCGMKVPQILLTGDHKKIDEWRKSQQLNLG